MISSMDPGASKSQPHVQRSDPGPDSCRRPAGREVAVFVAAKTLLEPHRTSDQAEARNLGYTNSYRLPRLLAIVDSIDAARPLS